VTPVSESSPGGAPGGRTYLVTGGAGFIGSVLVRALVDAGAKVRVLDDCSRGSPRRLQSLEGRIEFFDGDVRDPAAVTRAAEGADWILHLAAVNGTENFYKYPERVLDVALRGVLAVVDACRAAGVRNLLLASSAEVYQTPPHVPTDETVPLVVPDVLNPRYSYGGGKIVTELVGVNYGRGPGFDRVLMFRPHNVYGPDMGGEHVLPQLTLRALDLADRQPAGPLLMPIQGDGSQTRAFAYVDDVVAGILALLERGEHLGIYHIGNPEEVAIRDLIPLIGDAIGREIVLEPGLNPEGATERRCPDITKIAKLGYAPKIPLREGLPRLVQWYAANRALFAHG
jgi:dTDP-glucose 4,6-dehydratase/UDP-glucose 4-epimerase